MGAIAQYSTSKYLCPKKKVRAVQLEYSSFSLQVQRFTAGLTEGRDVSACPTAVDSSPTPAPRRPEASAEKSEPDPDPSPNADCFAGIPGTAAAAAAAAVEAVNAADAADATAIGTTTATSLSQARTYDLERHRNPSRQDWAGEGRGVEG